MQSFDKNYKRLDCDHDLSLKCRMKSKIKFNHCLHKNKFTFRKAKPTKNSENWLCFKRHRCLSDGSWIYLHRYVHGICMPLKCFVCSTLANVWCNVSSSLPCVFSLGNKHNNVFSFIVNMLYWSPKIDSIVHRSLIP